MGVAVGLMWIMYLIVFFIAIGIYFKHTKKKKNRFLFMAFFILLPTWDVIVQLGIKTYFQTFKMEPIIYAYPERDENGKIESLGLGDVTSVFIKRFVGKSNTSNYISSYYSDIPLNVANYIEVEGIGDNKKQMIRIHLNYNPYKIEEIEIQKSRYQVNMTDSEDGFLGFYREKKFFLKDTTNGKVLAEAFMVYFPNHRWYAWFRDDILFNKDLLDLGRNIAVMRVRELDNLDEMVDTSLRIKIIMRKKYKGLKYD